jgi:hypothetical protein
MTEQETRATRFPVLDTEGPVTRELSLEERYVTLATLYKYQYFATYRQIAARFGWDAAIEIADEMAAEAIPHIAEGYRRKFALPGVGAALVAQVHVTEMLVEGADVEMISESEERAEYKVLCPWGSAIQSGRFQDALPITEGLCTRGCVGFMQRVSDGVKDGLEVRRRTWMGDGAPSCHFELGPQTAE